MLYVSAVMNHAAQSEMNIYLLRAIESLVKTKQYESLDTAIKVFVVLYTAWKFGGIIVG